MWCLSFCFVWISATNKSQMAFLQTKQIVQKYLRNDVIVGNRGIICGVRRKMIHT